MCAWHNVNKDNLFTYLLSVAYLPQGIKGKESKEEEEVEEEEEEVNLK